MADRESGRPRTEAIAIERQQNAGACQDQPDRGMEAVVARARAGDRAAFERLYRAHVGRVHGLCLRMSGDRARAEELTQDVFVTAWRKLNSFRGDSAFSSWLHRVTVNTVLQSRRSEKRRLARREAVGVDRSAFGGGAADGAAPGLRLDLERAIAGLPPGARQVFVLHEIEGMRYSEIAERYGQAVGTLKAQMHRARKLLREALER